MKAQLSNVAEIFAGVNVRTGGPVDIHCLQLGYFDNEGRFDESVKPNAVFEERLRKHLLRNGDVLFAAKGVRNRAVVYRGNPARAIASSTIVVLRPVVTDLYFIDPEYLAWTLNSRNTAPSLNSITGGSTVQSISISSLMHVSIDIPPINVQRLIAKISTLRVTERRLAEQMERLKDALLEKQLSRIISPSH